MNNKNKALLLSIVSSLTLLCGCGESKTIEIEGNTYVKSGEEYVKVDNQKVVYEPYTHYIQYFNYDYEGDDYETPYSKKSGFTNSNVPVIEGYELVTIEEVTRKYGYGSKTCGYMYIFVNNKPVEVTLVYNPKTNTYEYNNPGVVVSELSLSK